LYIDSHFYRINITFFVIPTNSLFTSSLFLNVLGESCFHFYIRSRAFLVEFSVVREYMQIIVCSANFFLPNAPDTHIRTELHLQEKIIRSQYEVVRDVKFSSQLSPYLILNYVLKFEYVGIWCCVYPERKCIPFANELANRIYFRSLDSELCTFEQTRWN